MKTLVRYTLIFMMVLPLTAKVNGTLTVKKSDSQVTIFGTSSLHDWEEDVKDFTVQGTWKDNLISNLELKMKTASIESGKSIMDDKTHEALKADKYPWITFSASELTIEGTDVSGDGQLTIAGKSQPIKVKSVVKEKGTDYLIVTGSEKINMKNYGIEPPTAMFGSLLTGELVTISYEFKLIIK
ncbi:MAG: YceI family protein [Cyclobacteriaceae bacterium]